MGNNPEFPETVEVRLAETTSLPVTEKKSRKKLIAGVVAGVLVLAAAGGGVAYKLHLDEQERQAVLALCKDATSEYEAAVKSAEKELAEVEKLLAASTDEAIQQEIAGATAYSARPEVKEDKEQKVAARKSGKQLVAAVQGAEKQLTTLSKQAQKCVSRENAETVAADTKKLNTEVKASTAARKALADDVAAFKSEEQARIQAEAEAAAKAEAERIAAEQAAAAAAAQAAAAQAQSYGGGYSGGGYGGYNSGYTAPAPAPSGGSHIGGFGGGTYDGPTLSTCVDPATGINHCV